LIISCKQDKKSDFILKQKINEEVEKFLTSNKHFKIKYFNDYYFPLDDFNELWLVDSNKFRQKLDSIPKSELPENKNIDSIIIPSIVQTMSIFLYSLNEPKLNDTNRITDEYRISYMPCFNYPRVVRIVKDSEGIYLICKVTDGDGGHTIGHVKTEIKKQLEFNEWKKIDSLFKNTNFMNLNTMDDYSGFDGTIAFIEHKNGKKYKVIKRWLPARDKKINEITNLFWTLCDIKITKLR